MDLAAVIHEPPRHVAGSALTRNTGWLMVVRNGESALIGFAF
jgi:hypothetical protein